MFLISKFNNCDHTEIEESFGSSKNNHNDSNETQQNDSDSEFEDLIRQFEQRLNQTDQSVFQEKPWTKMIPNISKDWIEQL